MSRRVEVPEDPWNAQSGSKHLDVTIEVEDKPRDWPGKHFGERHLQFGLAHTSMYQRQATSDKRPDRNTPKSGSEEDAMAMESH